MSDLYILNENGEPIAESDIRKWGVWYEQREKRVVKQEMIGESKVSTVLWQTMVFGGPLDLEQDRCSGNREQAEAMHSKMVARVKGETDAKE